MSRYSHRLRVREGISGAKLATCFPAAFDQELPPGEALTKVSYEAYARFDSNYNLLQKIGERTLRVALRDTLDTIARDGGYHGIADLEFVKVTSRPELDRVIRRFVQEGCGVIVETLPSHTRPHDGKVSHSIGLIPIDDNLYEPVSNWVQRGFKQGVTTEQLYPYLSHFPDVSFSKRYPFGGANITALPSVA
jgi:hypothetical protein